MSSPAATRQKQRFRSFIPYIFLLPAILLNVCIVSGPAFGTLAISLTNWDGLHAAKFIGLSNYGAMLQDPQFTYALTNNFKWLLVYCTVPVVVGLLTALVVRSLKRTQMVVRTLLFMPYILPTVVTAEIWSLIYNPFTGIDSVLAQWHLPAPSWLGDPSIALYSVVFVDVWRFWGFVMIIMLSALHQADKNLEEAAMLDGVNRVGMLWHVIIPQLRPTLVLVVSLCMIWSFTAFDYVYIMTRGGPGYSTQLISTYMYQQTFQADAAGYASSIALAMLLFAGLVIAGFAILRKRGWQV